MTITVNRSPHGPLSISVQIDACLRLPEALALRAELDRAISAIQSERQMVALVEDAATKARRGDGITDEEVFNAMVDNDITVDMPPKKSRRVKFTFDEGDLSPLDNMTDEGTTPPIDLDRWEVYAMGRAAGNESEGNDGN